MIILLATAFIQADVQVAMFMHAEESEDKASIYAHVWYSVFLAVITILGSLLCIVGAYKIPGI
ncbi:cytochrome C oxidase subunit IV family protein [Peribacillus asahii]|uniref:cytochrome C oxidase subunit IV family protein n=1 Tax=Peribacillus asahii TaxID=228899 RepID=UPI0037FB5AA5